MNSATELSIAFLETRPDGAARVLDQIPQDVAAAFLEQAPEAAAATVLGFMQPAHAAALLERLTPRKAAALLTQLASHVRPVLLRAMPEAALAPVLAVLPKRAGATMRRYLAYDPGTVGAWMDAPKASFAADMTVGDCLKRVRLMGTRLGSLVFVINAERRLLGSVDIDGLLAADDAVLLADLMHKDTATLARQASLASVVSLTDWDTALSLPVTDRNRRLVGVLHFDSLREGLVVDRGPAGGSQATVLIMHLMQALLVSMSGLIHIATAEPALTRLADESES